MLLTVSFYPGQTGYVNKQERLKRRAKINEQLYQSWDSCPNQGIGILLSESTKLGNCGEIKEQTELVKKIDECQKVRVP